MEITMQNIDIVKIDQELMDINNKMKGANINDFKIQLNKLKEDINQSKYKLNRPMRISLIGRISTGKSSLLNKLFGCELLPVSIGPTTKCCTVICVHAKDDITFDVIYKDKSKSFSRPDGVKDYLYGIYGAANCTDRVTILLPVDNDKYSWLTNLKVIDTPGLGYSDAMNDVILEQCSQSDVIIVAVNASKSIGDEEWGIFKLLSKKRFIAKFAFFFTCLDKVAENEIESVKFHRNYEIEKLTDMRMCHFPIETYFLKNMNKKDADNEIVKIFEKEICRPCKIDFDIIERYFEESAKQRHIATTDHSTVEPHKEYVHLAILCIEFDLSEHDKKEILKKMTTYQNTLTILIESFLDVVDKLYKLPNKTKSDTTTSDTPYKQEAMENILILFSHQHHCQMFMHQFIDMTKFIGNKEISKMKLFVFFTEMAIGNVGRKDGNKEADLLHGTLQYYRHHSICDHMTQIVNILQVALDAKKINKYKFKECYQQCIERAKECPDESIRLRCFLVFTEISVHYLYKKKLNGFSRIWYITNDAYLGTLEDLIYYISNIPAASNPPKI